MGARAQRPDGWRRDLTQARHREHQAPTQRALVPGPDTESAGAPHKERQDTKSALPRRRNRQAPTQESSGACNNDIQGAGTWRRGATKAPNTAPDE